MPRKSLSLTKLGKNTELSDILRLIFGLSKAEINVLFFLLQSQRCQCIKSLTDRFQKDRTTIQRNLNKLLKFKLIERKKKTYKEFMTLCQEHDMQEYEPEYERGYLYIYEAISIMDLKKILLEEVNSGFAQITDAIQQI